MLFFQLMSVFLLNQTKSRRFTKRSVIVECGFRMDYSKKIVAICLPAEGKYSRSADVCDITHRLKNIKRNDSTINRTYTKC